jgi:mannose-6-phosphate isomerase-like protein (cupin superfamily)
MIIKETKTMAAKGLISKPTPKSLLTDLKGHAGMNAYELIRPGKDGSMHLRLVLDEVEPGGKIEPHYHELTPVCDHGYYVISGEIKARIGDKTEVVGPDTLLYCQTDVIHSIENVGKTTAKLLRLGAAADGNSSGKSVFVKE